MIGGVPRALLVMASHPLFAAGIAEHSMYRRDPWERLAGSIESFYAIVFGSRSDAEAAANRVYRKHAAVCGRTSENAGPFPAGTHYAALEPGLLLWVYAAIIDTGLVMYRTYVGPLTTVEEETVYAEMKIVGRLFGIPSDLIPDTLGELRSQARERLESPEITVTEAARAIARDILHPPLPPKLRPVSSAVQVVTVGVLPPKLRYQYGLRWGTGTRALYRASVRFSGVLDAALRRSCVENPRLARAYALALG